MSAQPQDSKGMDYLVSLGGFTAIGVFIYAVLRFTYWSFYNRFGVTPEEVGLGYVEILTRSAPVLVTGITFAAGVNFVLAHWYFRLNPQRTWWVVGVTVGLFLAAVLIAGPIRAQRLADLVEHGIPVHPRLAIELVAVQVDYVTLRPHEQATEQEGASPTSAPRVLQAASLNQDGSQSIDRRTSLLYFGQSNQIAVLYDHLNQQIIRVPITDVIIIAE